MTLTEVKALLNETSTTYDDFYENLIPELEQYAREYTNDKELMFTSATVKLFIAKACEHMAQGVAAGVESEKLGDYAITYAQSESNVGAFPTGVLAYLNTHRRPRWG